MDGDKRKSILASCLFFLLFVSVLAVSTIIGGYPGKADLESPSTIRRAVARWWGNASVEPCVNFYNFSCQRYTKSAPLGLSILGQSQLSVISRQPTASAPHINKSSVGDPIDAGIFPFYAVETRYNVVYIYPINNDPADGPAWMGGRRRRTLEQLCYQQVMYMVFPGINWSSLLNRTADIFNQWIQSFTVYLVNDNDLCSDITEPWFIQRSHAQATSGLELSQQADACVDAQIADLNLNSLFATSQVLLDSEEVHSIVESVVSVLRPLNLIFAGVGLRTGGPEPPCTGRSVAECLQFVWYDQLSLLQRNVSVFAPWPFSNLMTNAVYNHIDNTVYIPTGLLSWPFFDPEWSWRLRLVSLGWIIAHEFSHAIPISQKQAACVDSVESALTAGASGTGGRGAGTANLHALHRANMTLNENYADHMALKYITDILRMDDQRPVAMQESFLVWAQTWCDGNPEYWYPNDTHQSPALRVNATLEMSMAFSNAFKCPRRYPTCTPL